MSASQPYLDLPCFPGRTLITKLHIDDLALEAASYNADAGGFCLLCGLGPETRFHFVLECPVLEPFRVAFSHLIPALLPGLPLLKRFQTILLVGHIPFDQLNIRAGNSGALLRALWTRRRQAYAGVAAIFPLNILLAT